MFRSIFHAVLESVSYNNYLWPVGFFRILFGSFYVQKVVQFRKDNFSSEPRLINYVLERVGDDPFSVHLSQFLSSNWQLSFYALCYVYLLIAWSLILGFCVRLSCFLGFVMMLTWSVFMKGQHEFYLLQAFIFLAFLLLSAGRSLGIDYYFYQRKRSIFW